MVARHFILFAFALAAAGFGCGGGGGTGGNGTTSSSGSGGAGGGGPTPVEYPFGLIRAGSDSPDGLSETYVQATFFQKETPGCITSESDACKFSDCRNAGAVSAKSAGTVTLLGTDGTIVMKPDAKNRYGYGSQDLLWPPGRKITVKATGGDVPAFTTSAEAPPIFTLKTPVIDPLASPHLTVPRSQDLDVTWKGATGVVQILIIGRVEQAVSLVCSFDAAGGQGTVPMSMLKKLEASPDWLFFAYDVTKTVSQEGDWKIDLQLVAIGSMPDGTGTNTEATLQ